MIRVSGDFKALVTTAFDAKFFFDVSDHVQANIMALLYELCMQSLNTIALTSFTVSSPNQ
jgi:hypothetical protein